jgi:hypothetical protein
VQSHVDTMAARTVASAAASEHCAGAIVLLVDVVDGGVHDPKPPCTPALFVGVGQASAKSAWLSPVAPIRERLCTASPAPSGVGVPDVGVPACVLVFRGPV